MSKRLRIGLVGCGIISENHIKAYLELKDRVEVTVCCDIDPKKAALRSELAGGAKVVTDSAEVIGDANVDAVDFCTPPHLHRDAVIAAAQAGKHIMCQKPLARLLSDCDMMIEAANKAGIVLHYAEMNRTHPGVVAARGAIRSGRIGQVVGVQATFAYRQAGEYMTTPWRYDPTISGGGQLLDSAIHAIAIIHELAGHVDSVSCYSTRFREELGGEDTSALSLRFKSGALGTLYSTQSTALWYPHPSYSIFGSEGVISIGGRPYGVLLHRPDIPDEVERLEFPNLNAFQAMINAFVDSVLDGKPISSTAESGREDLRLVLAAYESNQTGASVKLG